MPADLDQLSARLRAARTRIPRELATAHRQIAATVAGHLRTTAARAPSEYRSTTTVEGTPTGVAVTTSHPSATALERGGRVRGAPYLAVPLTAAARATGSPRHDGSLVAIRGRDGRLYLMSRSTAELRWRLVESVQTATQRPIGRAIDLAEDDGISMLGDAIANGLGVP